MATYHMHLADSPFELISNGQKKIEMRLNTPERRKIVPGDKIVFTNQNDGRKIEVLVLNIKSYPSFEVLYKDNDKSLLGYKDDEIANADDMLVYYKKEDILKYGVLAITIKLI